MSLGDPLADAFEETIAALPTLSERAEAAAFIQNDLRQGAGTGLLRGWFLIMKANRLFMESVPARMRKEFSAEIIEAMVRFGRALSDHEKNWKEGVASLEKSANHADEAANRIEKMVPQIDSLVQKAFDQIDTVPLSRGIVEMVMKSVVEPVARLNQQLEATSAIQRNVLSGAKSTITLFRKLSLPGITGVSFLIAILLCGSVSVWIVERMSAAYDRQLTLAVEANGATFAQLSRMHAKVELVPQGDSQGNPLPGCWALSVDGAEEAQMKANDPRRRGVIFFNEGDTNPSMHP